MALNLSPKAKAAFERLKTHSKNLGSKILPGAKGTAIAAATGGAVYFAKDMVISKIEFLQKQPYAFGAAVAIAGHFVKRKNHDVGTALAAIGGYLLGEAYHAQHPNPPAATTSPPAAHGYYRQVGAGAYYPNAGGYFMNAAGEASPGTTETPRGAGAIFNLRR